MARLNVVSSSFLGLLFIVSLSFSSTSAWGPDGHKIVASIGQYFTSPEAWSLIQPQLGALTLADIATLPDDYDHDPQGEWSSHYHYANCPLDADSFMMSYCANTSGCVVSAIYNYTYILASQKINNKIVTNACANNATPSNMKEPCPLSFLTHFTGDVHQPLHVAFASDTGGNKYDLEYFGTSTNLHSVWDGSLISTFEDTSGVENWEGFAQYLINELVANPTLRYELGNITDVRTWANESFQYTRENCYNMEPGTVYIQNPSDPNPMKRQAQSSCSCPSVGQGYYNRNIPIIKSRLMAAGVRLAFLLDQIYGPVTNKGLVLESVQIAKQFSVLPPPVFVDHHIQYKRVDYSWLKGRVRN